MLRTCKSNNLVPKIALQLNWKETHNKCNSVSSRTTKDFVDIIRLFLQHFLLILQQVGLWPQFLNSATSKQRTSATTPCQEHMNLGYFPRKNIWHLMILSSRNLSGSRVFSVARIGVPREVPVVGSRAPKSPRISLARTTKRLELRGLLLLLLPPPIPDNLRLLCCRNPWLALKEEEGEQE
jgi:hypothetical protein